MVKPVTQETPAKAPRKMVTMIARTRFEMSARRMRKVDEMVSAAPNKRLRENCEKIFGPSEIPSARPVNTEPKRTP